MKTYLDWFCSLIVIAFLFSCSAAWVHATDYNSISMCQGKCSGGVVTQETKVLSVSAKRNDVAIMPDDPNFDCQITITFTKRQCFDEVTNRVVIDISLNSICLNSTCSIGYLDLLNEKIIRRALMFDDPLALKVGSNTVYQINFIFPRCWNGCGLCIAKCECDPVPEGSPSSQPYAPTSAIPSICDACCLVSLDWQINSECDVLIFGDKSTRYGPATGYCYNYGKECEGNFDDGYFSSCRNGCPDLMNEFEEFNARAK